MLKMIHDLDNMLYPDYPDAYNIMNDAGALAAVHDCQLRITVAQARAMIDEAIATRPGWLDILVENGLDTDQFMAAYHQRLDHKVITPYPTLTQKFNELNGHADHVVLTHSNADWAGRAIDHIALRPWLPEERVLSWEHYKEWKSSSTKGFEMAAQLLQADPKDIVFADDSLRNLKIAKSMGMTTVWTSHGRVMPAEHARNVDHAVENIEVFLGQQVECFKKAAPKL